MNFAAEYRMDQDDQTQNIESSLIEENSHPTIDYLVAIRQNKRLLKVFRPRDKNITFGRSSRCSITLPDPRFSRKAGEIVLGPVPILRRYKDGGENSEMTPIVPGKLYRFRPYTLTLMESGDVIINRNKRNESKTGILKPILFILAALGAGSLLFLHQGMTDMVSKGERESVSVPVISEQIKNENTNKPKKKEYDQNPGTPKSASSNPLNEKYGAIPATVPTKPVSTPSIKKRVATIDKHKTAKKNPEISIHANELDKAIKSAALLIQRGDLDMAGRTLNPLLPHIAVDQRAVIIAALDPPIQALFQKAYMLELYEPDRSTEILQNIVESRLKILPSYGKARKVLDTERGMVRNNPYVDK